MISTFDNSELLSKMTRMRAEIFFSQCLFFFKQNDYEIKIIIKILETPSFQL